MGPPYHFIDLTEEQKLQRRELLDRYASLAQFSVLVPLLVLPLYFAANWIQNRRLQGRQEGVETPSSPHLKGVGKFNGIRRPIVLWRKWAWWCGDRLDVGGGYLGKKGEVLAAVGWLGWLLVLCFAQTGDDYLHLTKRFGIVAASQLPFHYLLAMKSPYSPLQLLTRSSHETLNSIHQLLGRIITILLYLHATFYINFYIQKDLLASKVTEFYVICGIVGIISFTALGTTALAPIRKWSYRVFYITHVVVATALLPVLFFHVSHIRIYLYETAAVLCANVILRALNSVPYSAKIKLIPNTNLVEIATERPYTSLVHTEVLRKWHPGQHAYVSLAGHPASRTLRSNPFSVASIPPIDGQLRFVARILDGNTARLARSASLADVTQLLTVEGPYGVQSHVDRLLQYDKVLLVAGGVGGTFMVSLYRQLLADLSPSKGSYRRQKVTFVWAARSMADVSWALPVDSKEREGFVERLRVCITGSSADISATSNGSFAIGTEDEHEDKQVYAETEDGIELEEQKNLLSQQPEGSVHKAGQMSTYAGRPDLGRIVEQTFSYGNPARVAVIVCGPNSLNQSLRREVGRWIDRGKEVWFWDESFAL